MLARNRPFHLLLTANFISFTGDWILNAGLAYQIYVLTGSTLASAAMVVATLLPQAALGSFAGVLADRWDRRRTMIACNLLLALTLLPLLLVTRPGHAPIAYAVLAAHSALTALVAAAEAALVPSLVETADLVTANALNGQIRDVARLAGAALGGVLAATGGIHLIAVADAATFLAAVVLLGFLRLLGAGAVAFGLLDLALFLYPLLAPTLWPAIVIMIVVGLPAALTVAGLVTVFQLATDDTHRGRIYGAMSALTAVAMLAGTGLAGLLADPAGIVPVIAVQGAAHCVAGVLVLIALPPTTPAAAPPTCGDSVPPDVGNPALSGAGTL